jgi:hypothetical protein
MLVTVIMSQRTSPVIQVPEQPKVNRKDVPFQPQAEARGYRNAPPILTPPRSNAQWAFHQAVFNSHNASNKRSETTDKGPDPFF